MLRWLALLAGWGGLPHLNRPLRTQLAARSAHSGKAACALALSNLRMLAGLRGGGAAAARTVPAAGSFGVADGGGSRLSSGPRGGLQQRQD
jgi:hypothetical protein